MNGRGTSLLLVRRGRAPRGFLSIAAIEVIAIAACVIGLAVSCFRAGEHTKDNEWKARELARVQAEQAAKAAELRRGEKASGALQAELLAKQIRNDELTGAFNDYKRKHPILARAAVGKEAATPAAGNAADAVAGALPAGSDPRLSLGAVWMWNSALFGRDAPAGACGLADTSEGACAADSGISLESAWDNQDLNARLCAEDRARHRALRDFIIKGGKKQ